MRINCWNCKNCVSSNVEYTKCSKGFGYLEDIINYNDNMDFSVCPKFEEGEKQEKRVEEGEISIANTPKIAKKPFYNK